VSDDLLEELDRHAQASCHHKLNATGRSAALHLLSLMRLVESNPAKAWRQATELRLAKQHADQQKRMAADDAEQEQERMGRAMREQQERVLQAWQEQQELTRAEREYAEEKKRKQELHEQRRQEELAERDDEERSRKSQRLLGIMSSEKSWQKQKDLKFVQEKGARIFQSGCHKGSSYEQIATRHPDYLREASGRMELLRKQQMQRFAKCSFDNSLNRVEAGDFGTFAASRLKHSQKDLKFMSETVSKSGG
jgi:flagellar biosynthesis GTPase FlhF